MKMNKLALAVLASSAAITAQADAFGTLPWEVPANNLFISGASAIDSQTRNYFISLCNEAGGEIVAFSQTAVASTENYNAYFCTAQISAAQIPGLSSPGYYTLYKRSQGGSGWGVGPVAGASSIERLNVSPATCTEVTSEGSPAPVMQNVARQFTCGSNFVTDIPDGGVSDVEPALFVGSNLIDASIPENSAQPGDPGTVAPSESQLNGLTVYALNGTTFGIQVTLGLRDALQAAQGKTVGSDLVEDMPSLTRAQVASLFTSGSNRVNDWNQFKVNGVGLVDFAAAQGLPNPGQNATLDFNGIVVPWNDAKSTRVYACRRSPGSGTQAQFNALYLNDPCTSSALPAARDNDGTTSRLRNSRTSTQLALAAGVAAGEAVIHENEGSSDVQRCLSDLQNRGLWAAGIQAMEKGDPNQRYVAIDGVAPTLENVASNKYWNWAGTSLQYRNDVSADLRLILDDLAARAIDASELAANNANLVDPFIYTSLAPLTRINYGALAFPGVGENPVPFNAAAPLMSSERLDSLGNPATCNVATIGGDSSL